MQAYNSRVPAVNLIHVFYVGLCETLSVSIAVNRNPDVVSVLQPLVPNSSGLAQATPAAFHNHEFPTFCLQFRKYFCFKIVRSLELFIFRKLFGIFNCSNYLIIFVIRLIEENENFLVVVILFMNS
jgi:hypothetical protein